MDENRDGWAAGAGGAAYPPAPWRLGGALVVSLWSLQPRDVPPALLTDRLPPQRWFGRNILATAFAVYEPGGVLSYNELLLAMRVRASGRGMVTVPRIWVDNSAALAGARALWAVPKDLASFVIGAGNGGDGGFDHGFEAQSEEGVLARMLFRQRAALPGWWHTRTSIAQTDGTGLTITRAQALSRIGIGSACWEFPGTSPLGFLRGRSPLVSLRLHHMTMAFGT